MKHHFFPPRLIPISILVTASVTLLSSCNVSQEKGGVVGAVAGAAVGGGLGALVAGDGNRAAEAIVGGLGGAAAGRKIGINNADPSIVRVRRGN